MKALVLGGAGYIGSHMCMLLAARGYEVAVVDDLSTGHADAVRWGTLHRGGIGDAAFIDQVFDSFRPDAVFHFAARSLVGVSMADPAGYYANNVAATLTVLDRVRKAPGCAFIFSSTAAVFGEPRTETIAEDHPTEPINPYGRTKLMIEQVLADYWSAYQLPSVCLRYFNAAGADASGDIGEAHNPETHLVPIILETALGRRKQLQVFGTDYDTRDGTCIRDYIHVSDLCAAHLDGLDYLRRTPGAHRFNLGNGAGFTVREVIAAAERVVGKPIPFDIAPRRPGDPARLIADSARAKSELGWTPRHDSLDAIVGSAWNWHRKRTF